jgi:hypothetical protein
VKQTIEEKEATDRSKRKASQAKRSSGSKAKTTTRKRKPASKARNRKKATEQSNEGAGTKDLKELAREEVKQKGADLARSMMRKALGGNVNCARFLLSLYEEHGQPQPGIEASGKPSVAAVWEAEAEWTEPASGEAAEALYAGEREPEAVCKQELTHTQA